MENANLKRIPVVILRRKGQTGCLNNCKHYLYGICGDNLINIARKYTLDEANQIDAMNRLEL